MQSPSNSTTTTLPRLLKNKPIAKIMGGGSIHQGNNGASGDNSVIGYPPVPQPQVPSFAEGYKSLPRDMGRLKASRSQSYCQSNSNGHSANTNGGYGTLRSSKNPPPPPRRGTSSGAESNSGIYGQLKNFHGENYSNMSSNMYDSQQLPLPPPPISHSQYNSQLYK